MNRPPSYFDMGPNDLAERVAQCQTIPPTLHKLYPDLDTSEFDEAINEFQQGLTDGEEVGILRTRAQKVEGRLKNVLRSA